MPAGYNKVSTMSGPQQGLFNREIGGLMQGPQSLYQSPLYGAGQNWLMDILGNDPAAFERFAAPFMRQFQEQTIPGLAERFGGMGAQSSSAFQQALGSAGAGLQENLAALKGGLQMQAVPQALNYAQQPFTNQQNIYGQNTQAYMPSMISQILASLGNGAGQIGSMYAGKKFGLY